MLRRGSLWLVAVMACAALWAVAGWAQGTGDTILTLVRGDNTRTYALADLEQMDVIKSWPLGPARVFLATLLPEVLLVSLLIAAAIAARSLIMGSWHPALLAILALQPFLALTWVILDNAVYLYAPVRYQPGQEGALHHSGRTLVMMLLRLLVLAAVGATVMAGFSTFWLLELMPGVSRELALGVGIGLGSLVLVLDDVLLIRAGGSLLRRFDVARDRG